MKKLLFFIGLIFLFQAVSLAKTVNVVVSILPQKYFVEQIGGSHVNVTAMVQQGSDPHSYEPKPSQLIHLSRAQLYFALGGGEFENVWLPKFKSTNPALTIILTDTGLKKLKMSGHHHAHHQPDTAHKDHHDHHNTKIGHHDHTTEIEKHDHGHLSAAPHTDKHHVLSDPHIWLSPATVKIQAHHIYNGLSNADPQHRQEYQRRYKAFIKKLDLLSVEIRKQLKNVKKRKFMTFHPSWGYYAHEFGLEQITVEVEGKNPKPAQLQRIIQEARREGIKIIFTQPQFSKRRAQIIAGEIGGRVISIDPLAEQWDKNLLSVTQHISQALQ